MSLTTLMALLLAQLAVRWQPNNSMERTRPVVTKSMDAQRRDPTAGARVKPNDNVDER